MYFSSDKNVQVLKLSHNFNITDFVSSTTNGHTMAGWWHFKAEIFKRVVVVIATSWNQSLKYVLQRKVFFILHFEVQMILPFIYLFIFLVSIKVSCIIQDWLSKVRLEKNPNQLGIQCMEFLPQAFQIIQCTSLNVCFLLWWWFWFFFPQVLLFRKPYPYYITVDLCFFPGNQRAWVPHQWRGVGGGGGSTFHFLLLKLSYASKKSLS